MADDEMANEPADTLPPSQIVSITRLKTHKMSFLQGADILPTEFPVEVGPRFSFHSARFSGIKRVSFDD